MYLIKIYSYRPINKNTQNLFGTTLLSCIVIVGIKLINELNSRKWPFHKRNSLLVQPPTLRWKPNFQKLDTNKLITLLNNFKLFDFTAIKIDYSYRIFYPEFNSRICFSLSGQRSMNDSVILWKKHRKNYRTISWKRDYRQVLLKKKKKSFKLLHISWLGEK